MGVGDAAGAAAGTSSVIGACWCAMGIGARQSRGGDNTAAVATSAVTGANAQLPPTTQFAARTSPSGTGQRPSARPSAPRDTRNAGPVGWLHPQRTTRTERATETHDGVKIKKRCAVGVLATRCKANARGHTSPGWVLLNHKTTQHTHTRAQKKKSASSGTRHFFATPSLIRGRAGGRRAGFSRRRRRARTGVAVRPPRHRRRPPTSRNSRRP